METKANDFQVEMKLLILDHLHAQIAVYSGQRAGGLVGLQDFANALVNGEKVICRECKRDVWKTGHAESCEIVKKYKTIFGEDD